jgi:hypothetical protein
MRALLCRAPLFAAVALLFAAMAPTAGYAVTTTTTYLLDSCHVTNGCDGLTTFGTITVTQNTTTSLSVVVSLDPGVSFHNGGQQSFDYNLSGSPTVIYTTLPTGTPPSVWTILPGTSFTNDGAGTYTNALDCSPVSGSSCVTSLLSFAISSASALSIIPNALGNYFVADLTFLSSTGAVLTGAIDSHTIVSPVPLPAALPLFGSALFGSGILGWWKRRRTASTLRTVVQA